MSLTVLSDGAEATVQKVHSDGAEGAHCQQVELSEFCTTSYDGKNSLSFFLREA